MRGHSREQVANARESSAAINRARAKRNQFGAPSDDFDWDRAIDGLKRIFDDIDRRRRR